MTRASSFINKKSIFIIAMGGLLHVSACSSVSHEDNDKKFYFSKIETISKSRGPCMEYLIDHEDIGNVGLVNSEFSEGVDCISKNFIQFEKEIGGSSLIRALNYLGFNCTGGSGVSSCQKGMETSQGVAAAQKRWSSSNITIVIYDDNINKMYFTLNLGQSDRSDVIGLYREVYP